MFTVCGTKFDPDAFLKRSKLKPHVVWHKGEPVFPRTKPKGRKLPASGIKYEASRKGFGNLTGQIKDALHFLQKWHREVLKLARYPGVEEAYLDFGIWRRDVVGQVDSFPPELVQSAGRAGVGIVLSVYAVSPPRGLKRIFKSKVWSKNQKR
ncbi:MAG: hypothetical protein HY298_17940 [Verrucomicrobia bacterium]|nr:hypothetical protein [Verrucomicrobiota bacterium]